MCRCLFRARGFCPVFKYMKYVSEVSAIADSNYKRNELPGNFPSICKKVKYALLASYDLHKVLSEVSYSFIGFQILAPERAISLCSGIFSVHYAGLFKS